MAERRHIRPIVSAVLATVLASLVGCDAYMPWLTEPAEVTARPPQEHREFHYDSDVTARRQEALAMVDAFRFDPAKEVFSQLLPIYEEAGDYERSADTLFWLGYCNEKNDRLRQALSFYDRVTREYPYTQAADPSCRRSTLIRQQLEEANTAPQQ